MRRPLGLWGALPPSLKQRLVRRDSTVESRQLYLRLTIFRTALVALLAILVARLWYLQIAQWANYDRAAEENRTRINWLPAPRGTIYDRNGETLADNRVVYQIRVAPTDLPTEKDELNDVIVRLAAILRVPTVKVEEAIKSARQAGTPEIVLPRLGESIQWREAVRLDDHRHQLPGITVAEACERHYPFGSLASHVLGYARAISPEEYYEVRNFTYEDPPESSDNRLRGLVGRQKVYAQDSIYGKTGIERMCETVILNGRPTPALQGRRGADEFEIDALNRVRLIRHIPPIRGASVYLTLDRRLQQVTEEALAHPFPNDPTRPCPGGAAVLVDVRSGEIVAMASYPAINLNKYITGFAVDEWQRLLRDERHPDLNRAIAGLYPTGSTFKMVTACAILECTAVNLGTTYLCTGREVFGRRHEVRTCWRA
ncbi:MAG: penicillin-binding transpeptidase domain-containing protein, partial [Candidatus Zipacnadales bacterium]